MSFFLPEIVIVDIQLSQECQNKKECADAVELATTILVNLSSDFGVLDAEGQVVEEVEGLFTVGVALVQFIKSCPNLVISAVFH